MCQVTAYAFVRRYTDHTLKKYGPFFWTAFRKSLPFKNGCLMKYFVRSAYFLVGEGSRHNLLSLKQILKF